MKQVIINEILQRLESTTPDYITSITNTVDNFITYSELPKVFQIKQIDTKRLPAKTKQLFKNIVDIISTHKSIAITRPSYSDFGFLSAALIKQYLISSILSDSHLDNVLYIDTNLLLEDYKKLMDMNTNELSPSLVHSLDVLYGDIEKADFVFWDKFTMLRSNYELLKVYDIISIRYRNCLGNAFCLIPRLRRSIKYRFIRCYEFIIQLKFNEGGIYIYKVRL